MNEWCLKRGSHWQTQWKRSLQSGISGVYTGAVTDSLVGSFTWKYKWESLWKCVLITMYRMFVFMRVIFHEKFHGIIDFLFFFFCLCVCLFVFLYRSILTAYHRQKLALFQVGHACIKCYYFAIKVNSPMFEVSASKTNLQKTTTTKIQVLAKTGWTLRISSWKSETLYSKK